MSELKAYDAYICENEMPIEDLPIVKDAIVRSASNKDEDDWSDYAQNFEVYKKSEADKVIAEKDAKILALDAEVFKQKHHAELFFDERNYAEAQLRHHKYKRCLAMVRLCHERSLWWYSKGYGFEKYDKFWEKWEKRWLELAEKFKEAK